MNFYEKISRRIASTRKGSNPASNAIRGPAQHFMGDPFLAKGGRSGLIGSGKVQRASGRRRNRVKVRFPTSPY